jgi:hypothetical protein
MRVVFWLMIVAGAALGSPDGRYLVGNAVSMLLDNEGLGWPVVGPVWGTIAGLFMFFTGVGGLIFMNRKRGRR